MRNRIASSLLVMGALSAAWTTPAHAAFCGDDDCGARGTCDPVSLLARCDCEDRFISVRTYLGEGRLGAYCVPLAAPPSQTECDPFTCEPHGVCIVDEEGTDAGSAAHCVCDPGFQSDGAGSCVDDPDDDTESVCVETSCGEGATCMVVSDAVTCRCAPGGSVILGSGANGGFGPVCNYPPNLDTACGPDACGPRGECVLSQAIFCDCEDGYHVETLPGSDGKMYSYCVDENGVLPGDGEPPDAGVPQNQDGGANGSNDDQHKCGCTVYSFALGRQSRGASWLVVLALGLARLRRRD